MKDILKIVAGMSLFYFVAAPALQYVEYVVLRWMLS